MPIMIVGLRLGLFSKRFVGDVFSFNRGHKVLPAVGLVFIALLPLDGCATEHWCNDLNDYTTLEADLEHCERKAGFLGQVLPGAVDSCMRKLGWRSCREKPDEP